ncbi:MAG TPA: DUF177 domain-containing protein [Acidobacteriaceae bacterium]|jgi:uncharacterized protein|nr:DUF177 domain-containing protein [Acidobacteriaceae bacterium]
MLIALLDLQREPVSFDLKFPPGAIDYGDETTQTTDLAVQGQAELLREHRGPKEVVEDIRTRAGWSGTFEVPCARCLEPVRHELKGDFDLLFRPLGVDAGPSERELGAPDTEIGYYQEGGLVLEDVLREQVLLTLPARTLCREDCKGLCPRCGRNLNDESCGCEAKPADARWSALADLGSRLGPETNKVEP